MNRSTSLFLLWCHLVGFAVYVQSQEFVPVAEGWICDENLQPHISQVARIPLEYGAMIRICIQPTNWTRSRRVVMRSIDRFVFSKGDRGRNGVQEVIKEGQAVQSATRIACQPGSEICTFTTRLTDDFFFPVKVDGDNELPPSTTVIQGNGAVSMEFATNRGWRLLRGTLELQRSRQAQTSSESLAGTDDIQIPDIPIKEQERGAASDSSASEKVNSLPVWAKATICVVIVSFVIFCCFACAFFGWFAGVESSKRKMQELVSRKIEAPRDSSGRTIDDDGSSLPGSNRYSLPGRVNQRSQSPSANQSYLDSSNRSNHGRRPQVGNNQSGAYLDSSNRSTHGPRPPMRHSDASVSSGRRDSRAFAGNIPRRPYRSESPQLYRSSYDSTVGNFREKHPPTRNPRMSSSASSSLAGGSHHGRSVGGSSSISQSSHRRHASLGPPSVQSRRTSGLSQSQHSQLPRRRSDSVSVSSSSQNRNNLDISDRSTHSQPPLTRNTYHGSRPGRVAPRPSFAPHTRSEHGRAPNKNNGPPPIRVPVRSGQPRRPPGQQPPNFVHMSQKADRSSSSSSSSSDDDDDDETGSFASASTLERPSDTESLSHSIRNQNNKKPIQTAVPTKKVACPPSGPKTTTKTTPIKKWRRDGNQTVPGRAVSNKMDMAETKRESTESSPPKNQNQSTIIKKVVTKKKMIKVAEGPPNRSEEIQEAWGDQLD